ncbi:infC [Scenedesmus sp. PABB004]|nr:infC [Scenedesmus sp. PABB004]
MLRLLLLQPPRGALSALPALAAAPGAPLAAAGALDRSWGTAAATAAAVAGSGAPDKPGRRPPAPARPKPAPEQRALPRRNHQIRAPQLLVIFPDGSKEVLSAALAREAAASLGLDLVEVNPRASPPVARILDYSQLAHEAALKADAAGKARRAAAKLATPKEMQFSARIADHDLEVKLRKVTAWLEQGARVQLVVKHGREEEAAAQEALDYLLARLSAGCAVEAGAKQVQRRAVSLLVKPLGAAAGEPDGGVSDGG